MLSIANTISRWKTCNWRELLPLSRSNCGRREPKCRTTKRGGGLCACVSLTPVSWRAHCHLLRVCFPHSSLYFYFFFFPCFLSVLWRTIFYMLWSTPRRCDFLVFSLWSLSHFLVFVFVLVCLNGCDSCFDLLPPICFSRVRLPFMCPGRLCVLFACRPSCCRRALLSAVSLGYFNSHNPPTKR